MTTAVDDERLPDPMTVGIDDDEPSPLDEELASYIGVGAPNASVDRDGPMGRVTIDMLELDELDQMLNDLRARRLQRVEQARALASAREYADAGAELAKFEKLVARVTKALDKMADDDARLIGDLNKLRIMATALGG